MTDDDGQYGGWVASAQAWIDSQGELGDASRREILDPALETILGDVAGITVLDVGCGDGRYARLLASRGALVTGIDPVPAFVDRAATLDPRGTYLCGMGEALPFENASFDIVLSYLTIIDIPDYRRAIVEMCRVVKPEGRIVVATISNIASPSAGWETDSAGRKLYRAVDRYMQSFAMNLEWKGIRIVNYHRPLSALIEPFLKANMVLDGFYEPLPAPDSPWYADEYRAPNFQIMTFRSG
jgi:2-polyprenyl-3-methyl-5-hydroxy-6-metoxy-1,4-benzoquinol methylase